MFLYINLPVMKKKKTFGSWA